MGVFEVSITVDPKFRGRNLASSLLLCAEREFTRSTAVVRFNAFIKADNVPSVKAFEFAGYAHKGNSWWSKETSYGV